MHLKNLLKNQVNAIFTELLTNQIIKQDQFWELIKKIYDGKYLRRLFKIK